MLGYVVSLAYKDELRLLSHPTHRSQFRMEFKNTHVYQTPTVDYIEEDMEPFLSLNIEGGTASDSVRTANHMETKINKWHYTK